MSSMYDKTLQELENIANNYAQQEQFARQQKREQYEQEQINLYKKSQSEMIDAADMRNFSQSMHYDDSYDMNDEIAKYKEDKLRAEMAPIYFLMDSYKNLLEYLPNIHQRVLSYAKNPDYTKYVREIAKNIDISLRNIQIFLNDRVIGSLDRDNSIHHILRKHLENIDLFNFSPDQFWHELNKDIIEFRNQEKIKKIRRDNELKDLALKHQSEIEQINAVEEKKQSLRALFAGWQKIDKDGNHLSGDNPSWCALQDLSTGLMWSSGSGNFTFPNLININFNKNLIDTHLNQVNSEGWCNCYDWRLPTLKELYTLYKKREILFDINNISENQRFWSADLLQVMYFSTGITSRLDSNQKCHIILVRNFL